ncbi:MAG: hypothetical protein UHO61_06175 [Acutalibacteraceae bacterium]|nr:hypothetical protein [Acutalibacteraceae bacterium]
MKQKSQFNLKSITVAAFSVVALLFVVFSCYMVSFKKSNVYSARNIASYEILENYTLREIEDSSAPIGIRKEYTWKIGDMDDNESCLMFYIVHSFAEVRFDGELIYSLTADNTIGKSPCSNWIVVPLYDSDIGKTATVTVTPVYKSVRDREISFEIGSRYSVFMHRLTTDLPQILISALCIVMGILIIVVQLCFIANRRTSSGDMLYLGIFSLFVGIWRITDTRFSPIIFENSTVALGYITLSVLFIMPIPMLLFVDERNSYKPNATLKVTAFVNCVVAAAALVCQITCVADLRETLTACHIMLILDIAVLAIVSLYNIGKWKKQLNTNIFIILLILGSIADLIYFYSQKTSSGLLFTTKNTAIERYTGYMYFLCEKKCPLPIKEKCNLIKNIASVMKIEKYKKDFNCAEYSGMRRIVKSLVKHNFELSIILIGTLYFKTVG